MLRTLTAIRHAKSSWANPDLDDRDRPLNRRGLDAAARMGKALAHRKLQPDCLLTSPALRALHTCSIFARHLGVSTWRVDERLYSGGVREWYALIREVPDSVDHLAVFAHMPTIAEFCTGLSGQLDHKFSTAAACTMTFTLTRWTDFGATGRRTSFLFPKGL